MKKIRVNKNIFCSEAFAVELANGGVRYACISPGSRSTPLTYAFTMNKKIKSFSIIDERGSGFFALGLAKSTRTPVVLICTSGTAVAELYPAIIEAYQSKNPLIVCTADRPHSLRNTGANQTINQDNIYKNHIRWFIDAGLPKTTMNHLWHIKNIARKAIIESSVRNRGPVHINFPFDEPLDPNSFTDEVNENQIDLAKKIFIPLYFSASDRKDIHTSNIKSAANKLNEAKRGIIVVGFDDYSKNFYKYCVQLSNKIGVPIFADAASNFRTSGDFKSQILTNYDSYLRSNKFVQEHQPDLIIQFGRNFTSKALTKFIDQSACEKFFVNEFGDWKNLNEASVSVIGLEPEIFCRIILPLVKRKSNVWSKDFLSADKHACEIKEKLIENAPLTNEVKLVKEFIKHIPNNSNLFVSNSLPIRDLDLVLSAGKKKFNIFRNRGASGIDGIISTALGIAKSSNRKTYLLIGDLAFYYDLNSLLIANKYSIPLTIILVNNNGGRIFEMLPIFRQKKIFEEFFATPHELDFKKVVSSFDGEHIKVKKLKTFKDVLSANTKPERLMVIEVATDSINSQALRKAYYDEVIKSINNKLIEPN